MPSLSLSRAAAVLGGTLLVIIVGCVTAPTHRGPVVEQKGEVRLATGEERVVPFPMAFAATPEIQAEDRWFNEFKIIETTTTQFRIRNDSNQRIDVTWTARGERPAPAE
jgi:hypothetical protein